jgi:hypothetical protein
MLRVEQKFPISFFNFIDFLSRKPKPETDYLIKSNQEKTKNFIRNKISDNLIKNVRHENFARRGGQAYRRELPMDYFGEQGL